MAALHGPTLVCLALSISAVADSASVTVTLASTPLRRIGHASVETAPQLMPRIIVLSLGTDVLSPFLRLVYRQAALSGSSAITSDWGIRPL